MRFTYSIKKVLIGLTAVILFSTLFILIPHSNAFSINIGKGGKHAEALFCQLTRSCVGSNVGRQDPIGAVFNISDQVDGIINADLIRKEILKHKDTGVTHIADHLMPITGKLYRHKVTGKYISGDSLEEVPHKEGLMHKYTGEIFIADNFVQSVENVFRHRPRGLDNIIHLSRHDYQDVLQHAIDALEDKLIETMPQSR